VGSEVLLPPVGLFNRALRSFRSSVTFLTFGEDRRPVVTNTTVTDYAIVDIPASDWKPQYRAINTEVLQIESPLGLRHCSGGLLDKSGAVVALWQECPSYARNNTYGLPVVSIKAYFDGFMQGEYLRWRTLDTEFSTPRMEACTALGVPSQWMDQVFSAGLARNQLLVVKNARQPFQNGDVVLEIDGVLASDTSKLLVLEKESVKVSVIRDRKEETFVAYTQPMSSLSTARAIRFCGILIQTPPFAMCQRR
jgi:hypothetical protein